MNPIRFAILAGLRNLKPNEMVTVYHGTRMAHIHELINGFDANKVVYRYYGGPKHAGLFVSPTVQTAEDFSDRGEIILEIEVKARNLHGTDWSGNTGRQQHQERGRDPEEIWRDKYPDSFRPYLSETLLQKHEPQALLRGLVRPSQIKRIRYQPYGRAPEWYTRSEFLALNLEAVPAADQPYGRPQPVRDFGADMSSPNHSLEEFVRVTENVTGRDGRIEEHLRKWMLPHRTDDQILDFLEDVGWGPTAARSFLQKMKREWT